MDKFFSSVQSFIHSVTTNDRYASYESQYRSSPNANGPGASTRYSRTPLGVSGTGHEDFINPSNGVSSIGANAPENGFTHNNTSSSSLNHNSRNGSTTNLNTSASSNSLSRIPYTPGMRSTQMGNGIPLQDYSDGIPAPPAPALSWKRIDRWVDTNYPELYDQLAYPVTSADLNELESDLDCTLPLDVRDSYMIHDGQERGGRPTGLFFGISILDLEGIAEEWTHWKNTAIRLNNVVRSQRQQSPPHPNRSISGSSSSSSTALAPNQNQQISRQQQLQQQQQYENTMNWIKRQESVPEGAIQTVYAHPAWIPLAKDFEGNNIAIDLAPGKRGRWGQVILFGRDFDRKYVIAPSWAAFLTTFADDLESGSHQIDDDVEEGSLMFKAPNGRIISYFEVLKSRVERSVRMARKQQGAGAHSPVIGLPAGRISRPGTPGRTSTTTTTTQTGRKLSSPKQNLISPFQSTTNLASPVSSETNPTSTPSLTNKSELEASNNDKPDASEPESKTKDEKEDDSESSAPSENPSSTPSEKPSSASSQEPSPETPPKESSKPTSATTSDDEVDMLDEELTEVQI